MKTVHLKRGRITLDGVLRIPEGATAAVLFAHGSGSGYKSPRNNFVAEYLYGRGLATLLFDLLTTEEAREDALSGHLRFNIPLLAERLLLATDWFAENTGRQWGGHMGYYGASTGAAAALVAASQRPAQIQAVAGRSGRPDLAGEALSEVRAPTLLVVGGDDPDVVEINLRATALLSCDKRMEIVPGATHLFEEPGTLEKAAELAADWFSAKLTRAPPAVPWL